jgi:hypothetical protein
MSKRNPFQSPKVKNESGQRERLSPGPRPVETGILGSIVATVFFVVLPLQANFRIPDWIFSMAPNWERDAVYIAICLLGPVYGAAVGLLHFCVAGHRRPSRVSRTVDVMFFALLGLVGAFLLPFLLLVSY